jgi:aminoglycoside phosphotransferase family enzyme/adenylate kinase family enzyme
MICDLEQHARLIAALARKLDLAVYETHISSVLVGGGHAWKLKKPVDLGFLDFSTLEKRKHCCEEEIRLNGRLAPDVYQRVAIITGTMEDPVIDGEGEILEYAVQMREFPADSLLADCPELLDESRIDEIAEQVARFQGEADVASPESGFGQPDAVLAPMQQNFDQILARVDAPAERERLLAMQQWTLDRFEALRGDLAKRVADGLIREGHGDMHLGNIAIEHEQTIIFDGIEFNADLRWIDVINEIAFLMMDLDMAGRHDLSQRFLNRWLAFSGDFSGLGLLSFYLAYRAMVRTKIAVLRLQQDIADDERARVEQQYRKYLALAEHYTKPLSPALLLMSGPSGSGKSVVVRRLFSSLAVIQLASDIERKRLAGLDPLDRSGSETGGGIYTRDMGQKTYARLLELCRQVIGAGFVAVADATFLKCEQRRPFAELAREVGVPFLILEMQTPVELLRQRVSKRLQRSDDPAEATVEVLEMQLASAEPLTPEESEQSLVVTPELADSEELAPLVASRLGL